MEKAEYGSEDRIPEDLYIRTFRTIDEDTNDANETTYLIAGEYSLDGKPWQPCTILWNGEQETEVEFWNKKYGK